MAAAILHGFPANRLKVIGVTGTSGKSTTVELIHHLLQESGVKAGAISGIQFSVGNRKQHNGTLRTTLRPWHTQKLLKQMVKAGCEFAIIEVSSHAIDQNRLWGIPFDTVVLTNVHDNEHLDYHETFAEYVRVKMQLFKHLNASYRKPNVSKVMILNQDDENYDLFAEFPADRKWSYSTKRPSEVSVENLELTAHGSSFVVKLPNHRLDIKTPVVGQHNVENMLAAIAAVAANGVTVEKIEELLKSFQGIPGRLEPVNEEQKFSVIVDFSYKPSGLQAVLNTLRTMVDGRIICVWGGAGGRSKENHIEAAHTIDQLAHEFVLTTDDPLDENPKAIAQKIKTALDRKEGEAFFEIEDRYEAIRYAIFVADPGDCVLIAGRGHEAVQTIGPKKIPFDDREVAREILQFAKDHDLLEENKVAA